ncbi:MAG: sugar ABC transporter permease [Devosia sp.]
MLPDLSSPRNTHLFGYLLLLPAVLLIAAIIAYPLILSLDLSFQNVKIARIGAERQPFTLGNYRELLTSSEFWHSAWITLKLIVIVSALCLAIGLSTALMVNQPFRGRRMARLMVALPWAIPEVVVVMIWAWIFDSSFGLMNWLFIQSGLFYEPLAWLSNKTGAFSVIVTAMVWKGYPFVSVMLLAGLQAIPQDYYNAAKVDGASVWQRFMYVTLPCLSPVIGVTMILVILWVFRDFSIIKVLTGGGPINATQTLSILTYDTAFSFFRMGYGAAIGMVTLVMCAIASRLMIGGFSRPVL